MSETLTVDEQVKTYRGATLEELLPKIREELGAEAVIVRRREGLVGGFAGFFQKRCVEVDARAGGPRIDVYDDGGEAPVEEAIPHFEPSTPTDPPLHPALLAAGAATAAEVAADAAAAAGPPHPIRNDAATREGLATPSVQKLVGQARPFADLLDQVAAEPAAQEKPAPEPEPTPDPEPRRVANLRERMTAAGLGADLTTAVLDPVVADFAPLVAPSRLRTLVRDELARRIPAAPAATPGRRTLAAVGPVGAGKTAALAGLAVAYAGAGRQVACLAIEPRDGGEALRALVAGSGVVVEAIEAADLAKAVTGSSAELVLVDTPPASAADPDAVEKLAAALAAAGLDEVHLALRAGTSDGAAAELLAALGALAPNRLLVTAVGETGHVGGALDLAIRSGVPLAYVAGVGTEIVPADPRELASKVVR